MEIAQQYIPQKPPFVFIDSIIKCDNSEITSSFKIESNQILVYNNELSEGGIIENIAQTAAAGVGYMYKSRNQEIPNGFIGSVKNLKIDRLPRIGEILTTRIQILQEIFGITLVKGDIFISSEKIACAELKIILSI
jgi:predicted hotdog family 3-hydroxylacyl-ACP dehydratase